MKLSTKTRYGIRAILELGMHHGKGPLQTKIIAQRQNISVKYLEQLMSILKAGGFVRSIRGAKGGYILSINPNQISLLELFRALEGPLVTVECLENNNYCSQRADCIARELWSEMQEAIKQVLSSTNLQDLLDKAERKSKEKVSDYQI